MRRSDAEHKAVAGGAPKLVGREFAPQFSRDRHTAPSGLALALNLAFLVIPRRLNANDSSGEVHVSPRQGAQLTAA